MSKKGTGSALAPNTITRTEAYQRVRSAAAQAFADERASRGQRIADFEQNYGSTTDLDESFVRDMRAMATRAHALAITLGDRKSRHDEAVAPNKAMQNVARVLAGAIGEVEFFLSQRRATSLFVPPSEKDFLVDTYGGRVNDPSTWVGPRAQHVVEQTLAGLTIVDDANPAATVHALAGAAQKTCAHTKIDKNGDGDEYEPDSGKCVACGADFFEVLDNGVPRWVDNDIFNFLSGMF
ncbi:MAG: hypothetical protein JWO85_2169, partial [Candidatus Eremiobacteraeota bacterium]|nr:hypothetical protein [Candidatus Eremiobacteraeota bacterium]